MKSDQQGQVDAGQRKWPPRCVLLTGPLPWGGIHQPHCKAKREERARVHACLFGLW